MVTIHERGSDSAPTQSVLRTVFIITAVHIAVFLVAALSAVWLSMDGGDIALAVLVASTGVALGTLALLFYVVTKPQLKQIAGIL